MAVLDALKLSRPVLAGHSIGFSRPTAAHVAHAVNDAVDQQGRDREMSQAFGPIA